MFTARYGLCSLDVIQLTTGTDYVYCAERSVSLYVIQFYNRNGIYSLRGTVCIFRCNSTLQPVRNMFTARYGLYL
jgi:hypothetical protein